MKIQHKGERYRRKKADPVRPVRNFGLFPTLFAVVTTLLLAAGGGGDEDSRQAAPPPDSTTGVVTVDGPAVETEAQEGSLEGETFTLNQWLPVPLRFEAAYQRGAPIVAEFFQQG